MREELLHTGGMQMWIYRPKGPSTTDKRFLVLIAIFADEISSDSRLTRRQRAKDSGNEIISQAADTTVA